MCRLAVGQVPAELSVFDDVRALRGNAFVVIGKCAQPRPVIQPCIRNHIHDARRVFQLVQLVERQKTRARKIRFLAEHAVQLYRMPNRFVNL